MITKMEITANGMELNDDLRKYINRKVGRLDKYISRHARKTANADIKLKQEKSKSNEKFTAEVILSLPNETLTAKESTLNVYAAIDIVEAKLRNQLRKYKEKTSNHKADRKGAFARIKRMADRDFWGSQN